MSNYHVNLSEQPTIVVRSQPGCLIQILYFAFIGWWLGALAITLAYLLMLTILGIPLGIMIINRIPYLIALRETAPIISYAGERPGQQPFGLRAIWFAFIGWWAAALWLSAAYAIALTIIGLPIGFWMFDRAPAVLTLHRG